MLPRGGVAGLKSLQKTKKLFFKGFMEVKVQISTAEI